LGNIDSPAPLVSALWYNGLVTTKAATLAALAAILFVLPCEAARRSASAFNGPYTLPILLFGGGILAIIAIGAAIAKSVDAKQREKDAEAEFQKWVAAVEADGGQLPVYDEGDLDIRLKDDETCYFVADGVTLCEPRAIRSGSYGGVGVRAVKGINIHTGRIASESHDEWRAITTGTLYVTDRRIVFDGEMKNRTVALEDIMSFKALGRCRVILNSNKLQKPLAFASVNSQILATVLNTLREVAA